MEKPAKLFSCLKDLFFYGIGSLIPAASDIDRTAGEILINSISHRRSLRKRSACLIQIYFFIKLPHVLLLDHNSDYIIIYKYYL